MRFQSHNITLGALVSLFSGLVGLDLTGPLGMEGSESVINVFMTTNLAAACGTIAAMSIMDSL